MPIAAPIGAALIGAGSELISNLFGSSSQASANRTNMKIAQMNNEWSEKMLQKQQDYNTAQWEKEKAYNTEMWNKTNAWNEEMVNKYSTASAQAKQFKEAGLNPALLMGQGSVGSVQSASPVNAPSGNSIGLPSPSGTTVQPYNYDFSGIGQAVSNAYVLQNQTDITQAQVDNLNTQSQVARARAAADIAWAYERTKDQKMKNRLFEETYDIQKSQVGEQYANTLRQGRQIEQNIQLTIANRLLAVKELDWFDETRKVSISNTLSSTLLNAAQKDLTFEQTLHEVEKVIETQAKTTGQAIDNKQKSSIAYAIVGEAFGDALSSFVPFGNMLGKFYKFMRRKK